MAHRVGRRLYKRTLTYKCKEPDFADPAFSGVWDQCKSPGSSVYCQGSDPGSNLGKLPVSGGNQGEVPVSGLSGEFGSTCMVDGPNTWEATDGHGPGEIYVVWRITEGLVVSDD